VEALAYVDAGQTYRACYARSPWQLTTLNYPQLTSVQIYSWGRDQLPGCAEAEDDTGTGIDEPNYVEPGEWPGWTEATGNLANWEE
jgi:hypothetical protein